LTGCVLLGGLMLQMLQACSSRFFSPYAQLGQFHVAVGGFVGGC
jgi:hypothetical protein